jgi:hypothetical protein
VEEALAPGQRASSIEEDLITPQAFANSSPGLERSDNPGNLPIISVATLKGFASRLTFQGLIVFLICTPGFSLGSNPGLKLANAFGVFSNCGKENTEATCFLHF